MRSAFNFGPSALLSNGERADRHGGSRSFESVSIGAFTRGVPVSLRDRLAKLRRPGPGPGQTPVHVDDPSFDSWEVVRDFADLRTARAWHQALVEAGIEAALTADWPLDRFGRGDIALRVPPDRWSEAELLLSNLD